MRQGTVTRTVQRLAQIPDELELTGIAATAYAAAAVAGASMHKAVDVIEPLRQHPARDAYELGRAFDGAVANTAASVLGPIVAQLRDDYYKAVAHGLVALCSTRFAADPSAGLRTWLRAFGEALGEYQLLLCTALTDAGWPGEEARDWCGELRAATDHARHDKWQLVRPIIERLLAADALTADERAPLLAIASLIELYRLDNTEVARQLAHEAVRHSPNDPRVIVAQSRVLIIDDKLDEAESLLSRCLEEHPKCGQAHAAYAACAQARNDLTVAEERLLRGMKKAPDELQLYQSMISLYATPALFPGREPRLLPIASQGSALDPNSAYDIQVDVGCAYRDNSAFARAGELLREAIARAPSLARGHIELARLHLAEDKPDLAASELSTALKRDPASVEAMEASAELCERRGNFVKAVDWRRRAVERSPGNPGYRFVQLASAQLSAGDAEGAWETARQAMKAAPDLYVSAALTALAADRWQSEPAAVRDLFRTALTARGEAFRGEFHNLVGLTAYEAGDAAAAVEEFSAAIALEPENATFHRNLADALRVLHDWDRALEGLDAALRLDGDQPTHQRRTASLLNERGNAAYESGDYAQAETDYQAAANLRPEEPVFWGNLALALTAPVPGADQVERIRRAVKALMAADQLAPSDGYGVRLVQAQAHLGRLLRFGELIDTPMVRQPITVEIADDLVPLVDPDQQGVTMFAELVPAMRERLRERIGFSIPGVHFRPATLAPGEFHILFFESRYVVGAVPSEPQTHGLPSAVDWLLESVEGAIADHAHLLFSLDDADRWWTHQLAESMPPLSRSTRDERRDAAFRRWACIRAVRACVADGMRIDGQLANVVARAIDEAMDATPPGTQSVAAMAAAADAAEQARAAFSDRLGRGPRHPLPPWATAVLTERYFDATEEHRLLLEINDLERVDGAAILTVPPTVPRAYLSRLVTNWEEGSGRTTAVQTVRDVLPEHGRNS